MFSIIIPIHNKLPHLERSINSVLNQTYKNFELILIDDASNDGSSNKLLEFKDKRIRRYRREIPGPGGYAARNLGINNAKYEWVSFLDADDEWDTNYLSEVINIIKTYNNMNVITVGWYSKNKNKVVNNKLYNEKVKKFTLIDYLNYNKIMWTSAVTIRKSLLMKVGAFPEGKCNRGGDMDTWIRCLNNSNSNIFLNKKLAIYYRDTVNQVTDSRLNPSINFCSLGTIQSIRDTSQDKKLLRACDVFCSNHIYSIMLNDLELDNRVDKRKLNIISSKRLKMSVLLKIYLKKCMNIFIEKRL